MESKAKKTMSEIYIKKGSIYPEFEKLKPVFTVFGFYSKTHYDEMKKEELRGWIWDNCKNLTAICLLNEFSWYNLGREKGKNHIKMRDKNNEETKSFFGILLDNIVTRSKQRDLVISRGLKHRDYFSIYLRDQSGIRKIFDAHSRE